MKLFKGVLLLIGSIGIGQIALGHDAQGHDKPDMTIESGHNWVAKITLPDGNIARIKMREGEMATLTFGADGRGIGITPVPAESKKARVSLHVFNLSVGPDKQGIFEQGAVIHIGDESEASYANGDMTFKIEILPPV